MHLSAANGSSIRTHGYVKLNLCLPSLGNVNWQFVVADVSDAIIGMDFLNFHNCLIDVRSNTLIRKQAVNVVSHGKYDKLLEKFPNLTKELLSDRKMAHSTTHHIEVNGPPCHARARRLAGQKRLEAKKALHDLLNAGIIRPSSSPFSSAMHMVRKKDGSWRICGDYRKLNAITTRDSYPLPHIEDLLSNLDGRTIFSKVDLVKAYHQIPLDKSAIAKTALVTPFGLFEYVYMSFGLKNASQTFQRFMDEVTRGLKDVIVYVDDILIASTDETEHERSLKALLQRLDTYGIKISNEKCQFGKSNVSFLGYNISKKGCQPDERKLQEIAKFPVPRDVKELQRFIGMATYYARFVKGFASAASPLYKLLRKDVTFDWSQSQHTSFQKIKTILLEHAILKFPSFSRPFSLSVDASLTAIGAVLEQFDGYNWRPVSFFSRHLSATEQKYSTFDRELLAARDAVRHFLHFVEGVDFTLYTDHLPLAQAMKTKCSKTWTPRQERHLAYISEFTTKMEHRKGEDNVVADYMSRIEAVKLWSVDFAEFAEEQNKCNTFANISDNSLTCQKIMFGGHDIWCDTSTGRVRPIVPESLRHAITEKFHSWSHSGIRATIKSISDCYVWKDMRAYITNFVRTCFGCQTAKIQRHTRHPVRDFQQSTTRFNELHADIVGPLPDSQGFRYLFTVIDRATRWFEAVPMNDITSQTCAEALISGWISRYGCPAAIVTDRGRQFEAGLWNQVAKAFGFATPKTTAYHPQSNGMVERLHRSLKASLMARLKNRSEWSKELPMVMMGLRAALKTDADTSSAELVFGEPLRLPGAALSDDNSTKISDSTLCKKFLTRFKEGLSFASPKRHGTVTSFIPNAMKEADFVFVRNEARSSLMPPYTGPHKVVKRYADYFTVSFPDGTKDISVDRLKPAFLR